MLNSNLFRQFLFWGVWLIIPLIWEIFIGIISGIIVLIKHVKHREKPIAFYPYVSVLVPVYNSSKTLTACVESIINQDYPLDKLEVFLIDNGSEDNAYSIFVHLQEQYPNLKIWWYNALLGKSKALNKGIFASRGKYVMNIDSDGWLDKYAIKNMITRFENDSNISCMTGVVLIEPKLIEETNSRFLKAIRKCELLEYNETFLVGRNYQSSFDSMYTLAGAFSCFKREALIKTHLYNIETVGEDTHMTYQIRTFVGGKVSLCSDAFFYVDPIESLDKLYIQRQRWQRGELEVASLFEKSHIGTFKDFFLKFSMRILITDHTLAFPRLIWFFGMIYLYFVNYPLSLLVGANLLLYVSYVLNSFFYLFIGGLHLKTQPTTKGFIYKNFYICFLVPFYRFIVFWMRIAGIINSFNTPSNWNTKVFSEEMKILNNQIKKSMNKEPILDFLKRRFNNE